MCVQEIDSCRPFWNIVPLQNGNNLVLASCRVATTQTFTVTLRLVTLRDCNVSGSRGLVGYGLRVSGTVLLLLVEDEPLIALSTLEALETGGFDLISADDGIKALDVLECQAADLAGLITDVRLGAGPSGWDVARRARELKPNLPVVYTTGDSAHEWTAKGVPKSVMIQKPYAQAQLITAISTLLTEDDTNSPQ